MTPRSIQTSLASHSQRESDCYEMVLCTVTCCACLDFTPSPVQEERVRQIASPHYTTGIAKISYHHAGRQELCFLFDVVFRTATGR